MNNPLLNPNTLVIPGPDAWGSTPFADAAVQQTGVPIVPEIPAPVIAPEAAPVETPPSAPKPPSYTPVAPREWATEAQATPPGMDPLGLFGGSQQPPTPLLDALQNILSAATLGTIPNAAGENINPLGKIVTALFQDDPDQADAWEGALTPPRPTTPGEPNPEVGRGRVLQEYSGKNFAARLKERFQGETYGPNNPPPADNVVSGKGHANTYDLASKFLDKHEVRDNGALAAFLNTASGNTGKLDPAKTAWCARFVNAVLTKQGYKGTGSDMARSLLNFGEATSKPIKGDVVVLSRGNPKSGQGHVGFYAGETDAHVYVLGGNQGDAVNVKAFPKNRVLGYRRPPNLVASTEKTPLNVADVPVSDRED